MGYNPPFKKGLRLILRHDLRLAVSSYNRSVLCWSLNWGTGNLDGLYWSMGEYICGLFLTDAEHTPKYTHVSLLPSKQSAADLLSTFVPNHVQQQEPSQVVEGSQRKSYQRGFSRGL